MRVLAFDACLGAISAAAGTLDAAGSWTTRASACGPCLAGHAEQLLPMLADVMREAGFAFTDLDRVAVTVGPGGFTGVRVGVATARALALATDCTLVAVTSLEALAHAARSAPGARLADADLAVAVDARRDMVFWQRFTSEPGVPSEPQLLSLQAAADIVRDAPAILVGSGGPLVAERVRAAGAAAEALLADLQPDAVGIAQLAARRAPVAVLHPLYLRPPDAKAQTSMNLPWAQA